MEPTQSEPTKTVPIPLPKATLAFHEVYAGVGGDENGGAEAFTALARAFYAGVQNDPFLRPMYPSDLTEATENLALFLMQYFGGPALYAEKRGHPRLRMRHFPFAIGEPEREAWLRHMKAALDSVPVFAPFQELMWSYFTDAARFLQNRT